MAWNFDTLTPTDTPRTRLLLDLSADWRRWTSAERCAAVLLALALPSGIATTYVGIALHAL
ncbi:MAG TPA: hypothetical protein VET85_18285 [Stellaceae bacterium]|nr:hypothetical protein [Stellaceae bacterium]